MKKDLLYIVIIVFFVNIVFGQHQMDSLFGVLKTEKEDTTKVNTFNLLSDRLWRTGAYDSSLTFANKAKALAEKLQYKMGILYALENIGCIYEFQSNYAKALQYDNEALSMANQAASKLNIANMLGNIGEVYYQEADYVHAIEYDLKAYAIDSEMGIKRSIAADLGNLGLVYHDRGNVSKALEYYFKSLKIEQEIGSKRNIGAVLINIGAVYYDDNNFDKALDFALQALAIDEAVGDKKGIATILTNIGNIYNDKNNQQKSEEYYNKALNIYKEMGDKAGTALVMGNMGVICNARGNYPLALEYNKRALAIKREIGDKEGVAMNFASVGNIYFRQKNFTIAGKYFDSSLYLSKQIGEVEDIKNAYGFIAKLDSATGNYKQALTDYRMNIIYRDSLINQENTKKKVQAEMNYQFEQQQDKEKAEQDKKDAIADADKKRQKILTASVSFGLLVVLAFSGLLFSRFRVTQKQKEVIEAQKNLVEEKNKEVLDSITYAKRLQDAILPSINEIKKHLPESFILYKPKDIVAGDFYWMEKKGNKIFVAAADCTGHGVPGAMVSVVCSNALNRTVKEFGITDPGKILDKTRELVLETFEKSEGNIQDGMDISLCSIQGNEVEWAGAYNPLLYLHDYQLAELQPDKQPIGKYDNSKPFTTYTLHLQKGDVLYLFTDGYADQFGGPKGKKFKYKQLIEKIKSVGGKNMQEQKEILDKDFMEWKTGMEQTDDVCMIGIKIE
jgi:tetratricopeptide (TPR) repeat protein